MGSPRAGRDRPDQSFARVRVTWATYGLVGFFAYLETVLGPLMPFLRAERGFSYTVASLHFAAFALGGVIVGLVGDRLVSRWGRRAAVWGGGSGMLAGAFLMVTSPIVVGSIGAALVMGFLGAMLLVTTQAILTDRHERWGIIAIAESNIAASICAISASLSVGLGAASPLGWRAALIPPFLALFLLGANFRREPVGRASRAAPCEPGAPALPARFWVVWGVLFLGVSVEWCTAYWGTDFLRRAAGMTSSRAAIGLSAFFAAMLAGRVLGSRLARVLSGERLLQGTLMLALAGFPVLWLASTPLLAIAGLVLLGAGVGSVYPLAISLGVEAASGGTDTATARLSLAGSGAVLIGPFTLGAIADRAGIETAYGIVGPLLVMAVLLTWLGGAGARPGRPRSSGR